MSRLSAMKYDPFSSALHIVSVILPEFWIYNWIRFVSDHNIFYLVWVGVNISANIVILPEVFSCYYYEIVRFSVNCKNAAIWTLVVLVDCYSKTPEQGASLTYNISNLLRIFSTFVQFLV